MVGYSPFGHGNIPPLQSDKGQLLAEIAEHHQRTPYQIILNFITKQVKIFTIPKSIDPKRIKENSESIDWNLTIDEITEINRIFPVLSRDIPLDMI